VAILLVFGLHCFGVPPGGHLGVDLFFLLSGFLITSLLLGELDERGRISRPAFYRRRAARLLPALALFLAVYLVIAAAKGVDGLPAAALGLFYASNIFEAAGHEAWMVNFGLPHLWSLAEEEQFYLLWPLVLPFVARRARPVGLLLLATVALALYRYALAITGASHSRLYNGPDTHLDGLLLGAAIAFLLIRRPAFRIRLIWIAIALPVGVEALIGRSPSTTWDVIGMPISEAALVAVVLAALTLRPVAVALSITPLRFFGRISYSLYLWHFMLTWAWGYPQRAWAAAVLSITIAYFSTRWVEEPLRRRFRARRLAVEL
jgi:peptidoglycan/LPS O-acetylase OafA/YrhL